ncbi:MAG: tRNA pseudouridine(13) synthase TruD [Halopseudomonas sp.]|uniref:tRNA pseudouridine(13) synthase TruD n=1 Tax=Halopseudomonas sp. TaxID=2901191 RepID=UPI003001D9F0
MTDVELLGPLAWGEPCGAAVLKAAPEDFRVTEVLDIELSGEGEHLWLLLEKRGLNTEEVARKLARLSGVSLRNISYAGLKDRQAVTRQWFSLQLPGKADPDLSSLWGDNLSCLQQQRHKRKLQRGAHSANRFLIRLTELQADPTALEERLQQLAAQGVPNYFGPQRFGHAGGNLQAATSWAQRAALPPARGTRSRLLSTARSYLFNQMLAERVSDGSWNRVLPGDCLAFTQSRSQFPASELAADDDRVGRLDLHPTAALWGAGALASSGAQAEMETAVATQHALLAQWLVAAGLEQARRILRLPIAGLTWHYPSSDCLELEFTLPTGCFATAVLRELVVLVSQAGGGIESEN